MLEDGRRRMWLMQTNSLNNRLRLLVTKSRRAFDSDDVCLILRRIPLGAKRTPVHPRNAYPGRSAGMVICDLIPLISIIYNLRNHKE